MATSSEKMSELVAEIAAASSEQSQGIEQISKAVSEMDKVVQQNAGNAEESASASEEMNAQAEQMKVFVEDLVTLVGGATAGTDTSHKARIKKNRREIVSDGQQYPSMRTKGLVFTKPASKTTNGNGSSKTALSSTGARPDQLIPFNEEDLRDF